MSLIFWELYLLDGEEHSHFKALPFQSMMPATYFTVLTDLQSFGVRNIAR